ncbi:hypothetical protein ACFXJ8_34405 [Nonomuraea sp. NPDC059194]|uniref:hypothetical protein n=1 Tax=Nonomuraea sp. NPDC059194 TaxID=3346764 RepID=UPI0036A9EE55
MQGDALAHADQAVSAGASAPLIAAGTGAITTVLIADPILSVQVPDYTPRGLP